jgi:hypothetical protein
MTPEFRGTLLSLPKDDLNLHRNGNLKPRTRRRRIREDNIKMVLKQKGM